MAASKIIQRAKAEVHGREKEMLINIGGADPAWFDTRPRPCPKCGGTDRFIYRPELCSFLCRKCFSEGSHPDFVGSIAWLANTTDQQAAASVLKELGLEVASLKGKIRKNWDGIKIQKYHQSLTTGWSANNPPITVSAIEESGVVHARWYGQQVTAFEVVSPRNKKQPLCEENFEVTGYTMYSVLGLGPVQLKTKSGWENQRSITVSKYEGTNVGIIGPWRKVLTAKHVLKVEGTTDMLAANSLLPDDWVAVCNSSGATATPPAWFVEFLGGHNVYVIGDADEAGERGAAKWLSKLQGKVASLCNPQLPTPGMDLRDFLMDRTANQFHAWLEDVEEVAGSEVKPLAATALLPSGHELPFCNEEMKPIVAVPGAKVRIGAAAASFGKVLAKPATYRVGKDGVATPSEVLDPLAFSRAETSVTVHDHNGRVTMKEIDPYSMVSLVEEACSVAKLEEDESGEPKYERTNLSADAARKILASSKFKQELPELTGVVASPICTEHEGQLVTRVGYDESLKTFAAGELPDDVSLPDAIELLTGLLKDFDFATPGDRSRAIAAMITPALLLGNFIRDYRTPVDVSEADHSQSGKGLRQQVIAAIYNERIGQVTQPKQGSRGVQSVEEGFDSQVIDGKRFIQLDNVRGAVDSQRLESFVTEPSYTARAAHTRNVTVDPRMTIVMITTNGAEFTRDLANRISIVRIRKREAYSFTQYSEGGLVEHVKANQPKYLGAVHAVLREWVQAGKPKNDIREHSFREWAGILDWIVQEIFGEAPLLDGHREAAFRTTSPHLECLRQVAIEVGRSGRADEYLRASELFEILDGSGVEIPGYSGTEEGAMRQIGRRISTVLRKASLGGSIGGMAQIDGWEVVKNSFSDGNSRVKTAYKFNSPKRDGQFPQVAPKSSPNKNTQSPKSPNKVSEEFSSNSATDSTTTSITPYTESNATLLGELGAWGPADAGEEPQSEGSSEGAFHPPDAYRQATTEPPQHVSTRADSEVEL